MIAEGEIDGTDRCQASVVPFIVHRQIGFYYPRLRCTSFRTSTVHAAETPPPTPLLSPLRRRRGQRSLPTPTPPVYPPLRTHGLFIPPQNARPCTTLPVAHLFIYTKPQHCSPKYPQFRQRRICPCTPSGTRPTVSRPTGGRHDQQANRRRFPSFQAPRPTVGPRGL